MSKLRNYVIYEKPYKEFKKKVRQLDYLIENLKEQDEGVFPTAPNQTLYKNTLYDIANYILKILTIDKELNAETIKLLSRNASKVFGYNCRYNTTDRFIALNEIKNKLSNIIWDYTDPQTIDMLLVAYKKIEEILNSDSEIFIGDLLDSDSIKIKIPKIDVSTSTSSDEDDSSDISDSSNVNERNENSIETTTENHESNTESNDNILPKEVVPKPVPELEEEDMGNSIMD